MRLLLAEDEPDLNDILTGKLKEEKYSVDSCNNGIEAYEYLCAADYDGAILDIMMPGMDGFTVLEKIRSKGIQTPVLFLTARDSVADRVRGLDAGAADYLVKPFAMNELLARIRVLLRKSYNQQTSQLSAGNLVVDPAAHTVVRGETEIDLSAKEFELLVFLLYNKNTVLTRETIENHIWNFDYEGGTNVVDVYISYLRKKIDSDHEIKLIQTVRGVGYMIKDEAADHS